ncbi:hypothetical protein JI666_20335 [Bacillus sp. NTK071]|uniref:hypothetical protein n=1 Tax=Bacillus sp. NTK071 TaxID=2802175 RepID=UPI001A8CD713|nr:hypothetical protein [Bacillus sp. NTK071]MBN8211087.1 hypothetical protein [Bacillus sp. NTK071]
MLPTKEQLIKHLSDKMTNQDIALIYKISFQKVIQLIKQNNIDSDELRKINQYIVYEHWFNEKVIYIGSGKWYRCRRHSNRRNSTHKSLMKEGKINFKIVAEFNEEKKARSLEKDLIRRYKEIGQANFNKQVN